MNILVTGGLGFIGSRIVRKHLERGDSIRVVTRSWGKKKEMRKL